MSILKGMSILLPLIMITSCSTQTRLLPGVEQLDYVPSAALVHPVWSPSGDYLMASSVSYSQRRSTIYEINLATHKSTDLITLDGEAIVHSWSPDQQSIALSILNSTTYTPGIWIFSIEGKPDYFVGPGEAAAWSPDGKQLAVFSCTQLSNGISYVGTVRLISLPSKAEETLFSADGCFKLADMTWSRDNKSIAFSFSEYTTAQGHYDQVFLVDLATKQVHKVLGPGSWSPSFSPNAEEIAYIKNYVLAISDPTGTCISKIKDLGVGLVGDVAWAPDGANWAVSGLGKIYVIDIGKFMADGSYENITPCP